MTALQSKYQQWSSPYIFSLLPLLRTSGIFASSCLLFFLCSSSALHAQGALLTQEIRYSNDAAENVTLVWGINGWRVSPEVYRLENTSVIDKLMHTEMQQDEEHFVTYIEVAPDTMIDLGFLVDTGNAPEAGAEEPLWVGNEEGGIQLLADRDRIINVNGNVFPAVISFVQSEVVQVEAPPSLLLRIAEIGALPLTIFTVLALIASYLIVATLLRVFERESDAFELKYDYDEYH